MPRFFGESSWDAVINHECLDIIEEDQFEEYCQERGHDSPRGLTLETLERLYRQWERGT